MEKKTPDVRDSITELNWKHRNNWCFYVGRNKGFPEK